MANESYRTRQLRKELERGGLFYKHHGFMTAGISDLIGCVTGRFVAIEAKLNTGKLTELQQQFLTSTVENGGAGFTARYVDARGEWQVSDWATGTIYTATSTKEAAQWLLKQVSLSTNRTPLTSLQTSLTMHSSGSLV